MKKITAAVIGAGSRGRIYAEYALSHPHELEIVGVAEPDADRLKYFKERFKLPENACFSSWEELLAKPRFTDALFICTMDRMHYKPAIQALEKGYHILLEKPMSPDPVECIEIGDSAKKHGRVLSICHGMRYMEFSRALKKLLDSGRIGRLISIQQTENVAFWHYAHSFVRGNWRNSKESSPMILQKSCHDMDFILWIAGADCVKLSSFGSLTHFTRENAPEGAPKMCMDGCPAERECLYYAPAFYLTGKPGWPNNVVCMDTSVAAMSEALKTSPYGRCVYQCDNDVVDHQVVNMEFANGVTASFTMCAYTKDWGRTLKLMGTKAEIRCHMEKSEIEILDFTTGAREVIQLKVHEGGHGGSDEVIMHDFIRLVWKDGREEGPTPASVSVQSHLMAFAAEKARLEDRVIHLKEYEMELRNQTKK